MYLLVPEMGPPAGWWNSRPHRGPTLKIKGAVNPEKCDPWLAYLPGPTDLRVPSTLQGSSWHLAHRLPGLLVDTLSQGVTLLLWAEPLSVSCAPILSSTPSADRHMSSFPPVLSATVGDCLLPTAPPPCSCSIPGLTCLLLPVLPHLPSERSSISYICRLIFYLGVFTTLLQHHSLGPPNWK